MPVLFAALGASLADFASGALLGATVYLASRGVWNQIDVDRISGTIFLCAAPPDSDRFETLGDQQMKVYLERFAVLEMFLKVGSDLFVLPYL